MKREVKRLFDKHKVGIMSDIDSSLYDFLRDSVEALEYFIGIMDDDIEDIIINAEDAFTRQEADKICDYLWSRSNYSDPLERIKDYLEFTKNSDLETLSEYVLNELGKDIDLEEDEVLSLLDLLYYHYDIYTHNYVGRSM